MSLKKQILTSTKKNLQKSFSNSLISLMIIVQATFIFRLIFLSYPPFQSDESVYSYASLGIARGLVPYREIALYQPPLQYLLMAGVIMISGPSLIALRLVNVVIVEACIVLTYLAARNYFRRSKTKQSDQLALATSLVFSFYATLFSFRLGLNESLFMLLSTGAFIFFLKANGRKSMLFLCGVLLALSTLTKYYGVPFGIGLVILTLLNSKNAKSIRVRLVNLSYIAVGVIAVGVPFLLMITSVWKALPNFLTQTVYWYAFDSYRSTISENIVNLVFYLDTHTLPLISGLIGVIVIVFWYKKIKDSLILAPIVIYTVSFGFNLTGKNVFWHHFYPLLPYLSMLSVASFNYLGRLQSSTITPKKAVFFLVIVAIISGASYANFKSLSNILPGYYVPMSVNALERHVGLVVGNLTPNNQEIWSSEGAIGFFADRTIIAPNSTKWPVRAFFTEVFGYSYIDWKHVWRGMPSYPNGCVLIEEFIQSWEEHKIKVLVFIRGSDWVPYPDELIWNGFRGQKGVRSYVEANYRLHKTIAGMGSPNLYEIWVRR